MQITIVDVGTPASKTSSNGRLYQEIELMYKDDQGKASSRKIMSFNTKLYQAIQGLQKGNIVSIQRQKNDKTGYWDWVGLTEGAEAVAQPEAKSSSPTRVTGSNYETKEERAARQIMIVRQSSLSTAVTALAVGGKTPIDVQQVIDYAKKLEAYVLNQGYDKPVDPLDLTDIENDIPV